MTPDTIATFKWRPKAAYRSSFTSAHVNTLQRMVARHFDRPHRFVCITDDPSGLDPSVEAVPLWPDFADLQSPHGAHQPSCYRRLKVFSPEIDKVLGERFVVLDLDTVVVGDLVPLWDRPEDFVIWGETDPRSFYNGSMLMMTAGARRQVWEQFDPATSPREAYKAGRFGSDQGWISHKLGPGEAKWNTTDGVYSYRIHVAPNGTLPTNARIVMFHGGTDPWSARAQSLSWCREAYQ